MMLLGQILIKRSHTMRKTKDKVRDTFINELNAEQVRSDYFTSKSNT